MSKDSRTYRTLTEEEIRDYLAGKVTGKEAHKLERHLLNDPFDQEAMDGFASQNDEALLGDVQNLRDQINKRSAQTGYSLLKIAATVALLLVSVAVVWFYLDSTGERATTLAMKDAEELTDDPGPDMLKEVSPPDVPEEAVDPPEEIDMNREVAVDVPEVVANQDREMTEELDYMVAEGEGEEALPDMDMQALEEIVFDQTEAIANESERQADAAMSRRAVSETEVAALKKSDKGAGARSRSQEAKIGEVVGQVTDEYGDPLPGVNVVVKGTATGTVTDLEGNYQLELPTEDGVLQFTFIGMESAETPVSGKSEINMELESDVASLSEVVVTGYGAKRKKSVTGAVTTVDTDDADTSFERPVPNGGLNVYKDYLTSALIYPAEAREKTIEGKVVLKLTIDVSGNIGNMEVKRSLGYGCDEEAMRLVREGPEWEPAKRNGERIESTVRVRVKFTLD